MLYLSNIFTIQNLYLSGRPQTLTSVVRYLYRNVGDPWQGSVNINGVTRGRNI